MGSGRDELQNEYLLTASIWFDFSLSMDSIPYYEVSFKLTFVQLLCEHYRFRSICTHILIADKPVLPLKCLASQFLNYRGGRDLILKCKGTWWEVPVNSFLLFQVSGKFRLEANNNVACRRGDKFVWLIPRRFRFCLVFLHSLLWNHQCHVIKEEAAWYKNFLKWMKIDFYEESVTGRHRKLSCRSDPKNMFALYV